MFPDELRLLILIIILVTGSHLSWKGLIESVLTYFPSDFDRAPHSDISADEYDPSRSNRFEQYTRQPTSMNVQQSQYPIAIKNLPRRLPHSQFIAHDVFSGELFHSLFVNFAFDRRRNHRHAIVVS